MEANQPESSPPPIDPRTQLRIVSVELNEATAELYKARYEVLYRRLRVIPTSRRIPAWAAALIIGSIGAALGAIPAMLVRGDNVLFVFLGVCAAYTILSPATVLMLADRDDEDDLNRLAVREEALDHAIRLRNALREKVAALHEKQVQARRALHENSQPATNETMNARKD